MPPPNEMQKFFQTLGEAIIAWQEVERNLYGIFHHMLLSKRKGVTSAVYHAVARPAVERLRKR
jgi:hypothetical protein